MIQNISIPEIRKAKYWGQENPNKQTNKHDKTKLQKETIQ